MRKLGGKALGVFCDFEARAGQPGELITQVMEHTSRSHGLEFGESEMSYEIHTWARNKMGKD